MSEILDVLFGIHLTGWKAALQFWTWAFLALIASMLYLRNKIR